MAPTPPSVPANAGAETPRNNRMPLIALTSLFFMWGFITCLNDILIPHLKALFDLSYTQAMMIQFCFFGAYFLISLPAGHLVGKVGYQKGIVLGLAIAGCGCLLFLPAARSLQYPFFLAALFVLASGITVLQVAANPYVAILGPAQTASARLTMTQAFNALGTTVAPFLGALLILSVVASESTADPQAQARAVELPYLILTALLVALAVLFSVMKLPTIHHSQESAAANPTNQSIWSCSHLLLGAGAIFVYVGAEVSIGSLLVNFLGEPQIAGLPEAAAAKYVSFYWGGAMVGRFIGAVLMQRISAGKALAFNAGAAVMLLLVAVFATGKMAMAAILLIGLCNSIMFPTIFSLALHRLGPLTSKGSSVLCLAIVGGALLPVLQGVAADTFGLQPAFLLPVLCYLYIAWFGFKSVAFMERP
jgi:MFS transporter, FHS family, L-fucose permease